MSDTDALRETCSGMYGGKQAHISGELPATVALDTAHLAVSFDDSSTGQVALVIYEWADVRYLGVETPTQEVGGIRRPVRSSSFLPSSLVIGSGAGADGTQKTYICTSSAGQLKWTVARNTAADSTQYARVYAPLAS